MMQQFSPAAGSRTSVSIRPVVAIFVLQLLLLSIGITRDYELKHEDNDALHATFARSHLRLGLEVTRGQNYFYNPATRTGVFYPNHPPGPGLVLALFYGLTGHDGPFVTRAVAIGFHVLGTWLFYGLARRTLEHRWQLLLALLLYVVLPESSFFGRMLNHEVFVLAFGMLLVRGYWESIQGGWTRGGSMAAMGVGATGAVMSGWAGFFVVGACVLHAGWEAFVRRNARARLSLVFLALASVGLVAVTIAQLAWAGGDVAYLRTLMSSRMGQGESARVGQWIGRILEVHWRYFGLTSMAAIGAIVYRAGRSGFSGKRHPADEVALIFLLAGCGYIGVFIFNASKHDYWQFLLIPASALGIVLLVQSLIAATARPSRRILRRLVLGLMIFDIVLVTSVTLVRRHVKREGLCIKTVAELRRNHL
jgi:hypothetical protein